MPDGPESAGAIPPRCRCAEAPEAWQKCPLPQHDHAKWTEHGWNCPPSCQNPDALAAKGGPMPDGPKGAEPGRVRSWWRRLFRPRPKREGDCDCGEFSHRLSCPGSPIRVRGDER